MSKTTYTRHRDIVSLKGGEFKVGELAHFELCSSIREIIVRITEIIGETRGAFKGVLTFPAEKSGTVISGAFNHDAKNKGYVTL